MKRVCWNEEHLARQGLHMNSANTRPADPDSLPSIVKTNSAVPTGMASGFGHVASVYVFNKVNVFAYLTNQVLRLS